MSLASNYTKNADCLVIIFDVAPSKIGPNSTEAEQEAHLDTVTKKWLRLFEENNKDDCFLVLVGNKIDVRPRTISHRVASNKAKKMNVDYFEVSAKTGENIDKLFNSLIDRYEQSRVEKTFKTHSSRYKLMT